MLIRNKLVPELIITDLSRSLYFWTELLGFTIAYDRPEEGFAYLDLLGVQIMLEERRPAARQWLTDDLLAPFGRGVNFQIEVPDVDAILERLGKVRWPLFMACEEKWYRAGRGRSGSDSFWSRIRMVTWCG